MRAAGPARRGKVTESERLWPAAGSVNSRRMIWIYRRTGVEYGRRRMKGVNSDRAYAYIRKKILGGEFPPGHPLTTEALARQLKISRAPVHDALRQLEADGLVVIRPRQGAAVKRLDAREFRELCDLRLALEGHAARRAAQNRTAADLREIGAALDRMRGLTAKIIAEIRELGWNSELMRADVRFHLAIIAAAKSDLIRKEILRLHLVNRIASAPASGHPAPASRAERDQRMRFVLAGHEGIARAIERGDASGARQAMEDHLQELMERTLRARERQETGRLEQELFYPA